MNVKQDSSYIYKVGTVEPNGKIRWSVTQNPKDFSTFWTEPSTTLYPDEEKFLKDMKKQKGRKKHGRR